VPGPGKLTIRFAASASLPVPLPRRIDVRPKDATELGVIELGQGATILGEARVDGKPYEGSVHAVPIDGRGNRLLLYKITVSSDESGRFRMTKVPAARYHLHAGALNMPAGEVSVVDGGTHRVDVRR